ncbi:MAG: c-type cytochrome [Opitutales bacterium]
MRSAPLLALLASAILVSAAEDGAQVYGTLCVACHGPDGKGLNGLPPLVGSDWPKGPAARSIKIVLNGMTGPVEVAGKPYNIEMPPQGAVLSDEKIAAALTYVRRTFAGGAGPVSVDEVKAVRAATAGRATPWTAAELLKDHPFPPARTALKSLVGMMYKGEWKTLPDFSALKPALMEDFNLGVIDPAQSGQKDHFAMVWTGQFEVPEDGKYTFLFDCDDFGALYVGGERIAEVKGIGPIGGRAKEVPVMLKKGPTPLRVEYVEVAGQEVVVLGYKGPKDRDYKWLSKARGGKAGKPAQERVSIPIQPVDGVAAIYRNFIDNTAPRAIGIGFPNGLNIAYSADNLAAELIWTGKFMDGGRHWTNRGQGNEPPAGTNIIKLSDGQGVLLEGASGEVVRYIREKEGNEWKFSTVNVAAEFKGYDLDKAGNPTFRSAGEGCALTDAWLPEESSGKPSLTRTLKAAGDKPLVVVLARGLAVNGPSDGVTDLPGGLRVRSLGGPSPKADPEAKTLTVTLKPGETAVLGYSFR